MFYIIGVLLLAIFYLVYRSIRILYFSKKRKPVQVRSNDVNAYLMLVFLLLFLGLFWGYSFYIDDEGLAEAASEHGEQLDRLFWIATTVILIPFTALHILLFWVAFKYRNTKTRKAKYYPYNLKLEVSWTLVTTAALIILIIMGLNLWSDIKSAPPKDAELIEIVGAQFVWFIRYPGQDGQLGNSDYRLIDAYNDVGMNVNDPASADDFVASRIYIPKGRPVVFLIRARDVIHSVFAPHFRLKMDALPGMTTQFWFIAKFTTEEMRQKTGNPDFNYEIACAEVCGRGHFAMKSIIVVQEPEEYEKWYKAQEPWLLQHPEYLSGRLGNE